MPEIMAFAGKGGVGKTTLAALLVRYLLERRGAGPILAVDADPNSNLNEVLGIPVQGTLGEARELLKTEVPTGMTKESWLEMKVHEAVIEGKGYDLLVMGRPEGPGCYCAANSLAKKHIELLKRNYAYVVIDNEAGMEHMSRLVTQDVDYLFVVADPTARGILTARRIIDLVRELNLNISRTNLIINRLQPGSEEGVKARAAQNGLTCGGFVRNDDALFGQDAEGTSVFSLDTSLPAVQDAFAIFEAIVKTR